MNQSPHPVSHWRGVLAVLNTPFLEDGSLDLGSVGRLADYMAASGTPAVLLFGIAAETDFLTVEERSALVSAFQERCAGRFDLIVSVMGDSLAGMKDQAQAARQRGATAINIRLPGGLTEPDQLHWISAIANEGPEVVMLQDHSSQGHGLADDVLLSAIASLPQLRSFKIETIDSLGKIARLRRASPRPIHCCSGWPVTGFLDSLASGVDAVMPTSLTPALVRVARLLADGREDEARQLFAQFLPLFNYMVGSSGKSIAVNKKLRVAEGVFATDRCRSPDARQLPEGDAPLIADLVAHAISLQSGLGPQDHMTALAT